MTAYTWMLRDLVSAADAASSEPTLGFAIEENSLIFHESNIWTYVYGAAALVALFALVTCVGRTIWGIIKKEPWKAYAIGVIPSLVACAVIAYLNRGKLYPHTQHRLDKSGWSVQPEGEDGFELLCALDKIEVSGSCQHQRYRSPTGGSVDSHCSIGISCSDPEKILLSETASSGDPIYRAVGAVQNFVDSGGERIAFVRFDEAAQKYREMKLKEAAMNEKARQGQLELDKQKAAEREKNEEPEKEQKAKPGGNPMDGMWD